MPGVGAAVHRLAQVVAPAVVQVHGLQQFLVQLDVVRGQHLEDHRGHAGLHVLGVPFLVLHGHHDGLVAVLQQHAQQVAFLRFGAQLLELRLRRCHAGGELLLGHVLPLATAQVLAVLAPQHLVQLAHEGLLVDLQQAGALLHVERAQHVVGDHGDALHDGVDGLGLAHGIALGVLHQQFGLEHQEVLGGVAQEGLHFAAGAAAGEAVGVLALGEEHHLHMQALLQHQVDAAQAGLDAGGVAVVEDGDVRGVALDQPHLLHGEAGAAAGHGVGDPGLVQADHVGVALHQEAGVLLGDGLLGEVDAVERAALVVERALGAVEVLGALLVAAQGACPEGDHLAAEPVHGEGDAPVEEVPGGAVLAAFDPAGLLQQVRVEALLLRRGGEDAAAFGHVAQSEMADGLVAEAAFAEVAEADAAALLGVPQLLHAPAQGPLLDHGQGLALGLFGALLGGGLLFGQVDVVALGEPADGLHIAQVLVLHQEADGITALAAAEALVDAQRGVHVEAGRLLVVEGAQRQEARPLALEVHELAHDLLHAGGVLDELDGSGIDHGTCCEGTGCAAGAGGLLMNALVHVSNVWIACSQPVNSLLADRGKRVDGSWDQSWMGRPCSSYVTRFTSMPSSSKKRQVPVALPFK